MSGEVVPFGRYKGKPVEDMLADADYMTWVEAQPWFRERYLHLLARRDADAASRTPVHNRLQTLFLNADYRMAFLTACGIEAGVRKEHAETAAKCLRVAMKQLNAGAFTDELLASLDGVVFQWTTTAKFEVAGGDVVLDCNGAIPMLWFDWDCIGNSVDPLIAPKEFRRRAVLEIKPSVADDYPAILRQMERNRSGYLFTADYIGEGATEAQFVSIFAASGKTVVFKRDVDREVARAMLAKLDAVGVSLTLRPDGKILLGANAREHPDAVAAAREHRDAIVAYLQEQIREADRAPAIPDDGTL